ncbi:hypothetical protein PVK64_04125 [Aliivibrio sp. S4TY2]|uniref:hypothetical protein n=1 Tax=unclassified Aliivibrio TaxID=2645654 RepID=UPI002379E50F|nr:MULTISPECIES: hypothetical protein [unclassified Aliivibrio]MDD9155380.1 hypothetical protein [Aliivibrio sp. S4TY2]MDD9159068.1 hypothetical protein [Aliivibrio sp. S4TY1]MDD9163382.1 hypothetical protein [Aliivibrio sp. S4MY2]MDD9167067.1 hypothetical protein [Aliivibrio sp. S4MY4]MDD9184459.1 hypothetical protein [Aliivibrio sp. S4MY3]
MKLPIKFILAVIFLVILGVGAIFFTKIFNPAPFGSNEGDEYITIKGSKPKDLNVTAWATFYGGGENCNSWTFSADTGKVTKAAKDVIKIEHDFSENENSYELRIPYKGYNTNCGMTLYSVSFKANNKFDEVFASFRTARGAEVSYRTLPSTVHLESRNCNAKISKSRKREHWTGYIMCDFYIDNKKLQGDQNSINMDFDLFNDSTVIRYDIIAGKDYRSEPMDPETGI